MSKEAAKEFFDRLEKDQNLKIKVREGIEKIAREAHFDATEAELTEELRKRWGATKEDTRFYSEPPGF